MILWARACIKKSEKLVFPIATCTSPKIQGVESEYKPAASTWVNPKISGGADCASGWISGV